MTTQNKTKTMVLGAVLTALVVILQLLGAVIKLGPFSISLVLVPIVIGAATCGAIMGGWLGLTFGVAVLISGDASLFLSVNTLGTVATVLLKGALCGYIAGLIYKMIEKFNQTAAVAVSAIVCPIVNTGIFLLGCLLFFMPTVTEWAIAFGMGDNVGKYMIVGLVGLNFLVEVAVNIVLSPIIVILLNYRKKA